MNSVFFSILHAGCGEDYKTVLFIRFAFCSGIQGGFHWGQNTFYSFHRFCFACDNNYLFCWILSFWRKRKKCCHVNVFPWKQTKEPGSPTWCHSADISIFARGGGRDLLQLYHYRRKAEAIISTDQGFVWKGRLRSYAYWQYLRDGASFISCWQVRNTL